MREGMSLGALLLVVACSSPASPSDAGSGGIDAVSSPDTGTDGGRPSGTPRDGQVGMHDQFACVRRSGGTVECFSTQLASPQLAPLAGLTSVALLAPNARHAVLDDGTVVALNPDAAMPVTPVSGLAGVARFDNERVYWAVGTDGSVRWRGSSPTYAPVAGIAGATQGTTHGLVGCAVVATGEVQCATFAGTLDFQGVEAIPGVAGAAQVELGDLVGGVRLADGHVQQVRRQAAWTVSEVTGISDAVDLACADRHCCALHTGGSVSCWGMNDHGQLGLGTTDMMMHPTPAAVAGVDAVVDVAVAQNGSVVVRADGVVMFWGVNGSAPQVVMSM